MYHIRILRFIMLCKAIHRDIINKIGENNGIYS